MYTGWMGDVLLWILAALGLITIGMIAGFQLVRTYVAWCNRDRAPRALTPAECGAVRPLLPGLDLSRVRVVEDAALPRARISGITFGWTIYAARSLDRSLLLHELKHVEQYARLSVPLFAVLYLWGYVLFGFRYRHIPLEREAFEFEARHAPQSRT